MNTKRFCLREPHPLVRPRDQTLPSHNAPLLSSQTVYQGVKPRGLHNQACLMCGLGQVCHPLSASLSLDKEMVLTSLHCD